MALRRNNTKRSGGGGRQNAVVELASIHTENGSDPNYEKDYAIGYLLHDAFGKTAEYDDQGNPVTEIRFQMKKPDHFDPKKPPASIAKLGQNKGLWKKVEVGSHLIIENAYLESRSDTVMAKWLISGSRDPYSGAEVCRVNDSAKRRPSGKAFLTTVYPETYYDRDNGSRVHAQYRVALDQENAKRVSSLDDFKAKVTQMFHDMSNEGVASRFPENGREFYQNNGDGRGTPHVYLRGIEMDDASGFYSDSARVSLIWDREKKSFQSVEESIDAFLKDKNNAAIVESLSDTHEENTYLEVIPAQVYKTGESSLPSMKKSGGDESVRFPCPVLDEFGKETRYEDGNLRVVRGFAPGFITLGRVNGDPEAPWFAKSTFRTEIYGPISPLEEVITPELPGHFRDLLEKRAAARSEIMKNKNKNKPAPTRDEPAIDEPAIDETDPGEGLEFGAEMAPKGM
ncbi:hypothetical protein [Roseibium sp. RKSG952]|uniref:hypothetical protein n=1 Tax=Roseibium sp. RKSG952 TaxID=2529384 RepID=UPI0012BBA2F5|nr:hypothetical protein [Roseibium sp. RKSG952]MTH96199.1 hypothetical protein [Roseibium sp. RKSG952]